MPCQPDLNRVRRIRPLVGAPDQFEEREQALHLDRHSVNRLSQVRTGELLDCVQARVEIEQRVVQPVLRFEDALKRAAAAG